MPVFSVYLSHTGGIGISPDTVNLETLKNIDHGSITLFSQDYSRINSVPNNIFIAKTQENKIYDRLYSTIYGILKPQILFNNITKGLAYKTTRSPCLSPCSLLPVADSIFNSGINRFTGTYLKFFDTHRFCETASLSLVHYQGQPRQTGLLYICRLTPMVKCTYQILMDIKTDDARSFVELNSPGSKLVIQNTDNRVVLRSYFENSSGDIESETVFLGNAAEKINFEITFDGCSKTNTISSKDGRSITTPFYNFERQRLPYLDFSNTYLKFISFLAGKGTYLDINIYSINQRANRKLITAIGGSRMIPFGLDGPHVRSTTEQGIRYLNSKNNRGTIWFDIDLLEQCNDSDIKYLRSLVTNDSWDTGVHYSKELSGFPIEQAYKIMDEGYQYVYEKIGKKPTSWCSLRNRDNIKHAIYAYENLGMFWRNGDSGIHSEKNIGNLDDDTWSWWELASRAGMAYPAFTHELDLDPAIKYSISLSKFLSWVENYNLNDMSIVSFYEYGQINRNTFEASFDILQCTGNSITLKAYTNGSCALVNVNINVGKNTRVYNNDTDQFLNYRIEKDKSITFWVENNHTYHIP